VVTGGALAVTYSSATLAGSVDPRGGETDCYFQYGPTAAYGAQTPLTPVGHGTASIPVRQAITGLKPFTTYHLRLVAIGPSGIPVHGVDRSFTTPKIPLSLAIAGVPNPVTFGEPLVVEGTLSGTGNGGREVALQAKAFPYTTEFADVGNTELTNAAGGFSFVYLGLQQNAQLRVVSAGKPTVVSPTIPEGVAVSVTIHVTHTRRHGFARISGTVNPPQPGAGVAFERLVPGGRFVLAGGTSVRANGAFSRAIHIRRHSVYRVLVRVASGSLVSADSRPVLIR